MKRIKAACIAQTLCFSNHDGETTEYAKKALKTIELLAFQCLFP